MAWGWGAINAGLKSYVRLTLRIFVFGDLEKPSFKYVLHTFSNCINAITLCAMLKVNIELPSSKCYARSRKRSGLLVIKHDADDDDDDDDDDDG